MTGVSKLLTDEIVALAESGLKTTSNFKHKVKLQAVITAKKYGIKKSAELYNVSASAITDWIHRLREESLEGLNHKPKKPRSPFTKDHKKAIETLLNNNSNITIESFMNMIKEKLGLKISLATTHNIMRELGFTYYKKGQKPYSKFRNKSKKNRWMQT